MVDDGASPAVSVSRLCRFYRAVCLCNGLAHHQTAGRGLDLHHAALGNFNVAISEHGHSAWHGLGIHGARLEWLLGLGSGRECILAAVAYRHCVSSFRDDAGTKSNDEGMDN